jgi:hypothetical protein
MGHMKTWKIFLESRFPSNITFNLFNIIQCTYLCFNLVNFIPQFKTFHVWNEYLFGHFLVYFVYLFKVFMCGWTYVQAYFDLICLHYCAHWVLSIHGRILAHNITNFPTNFDLNLIVNFE